MPNECLESDSERTDLLGLCARYFVQLAALFQGKRLPLGQVELDGNSVELITHRARDEPKVSCVHSRGDALRVGCMSSIGCKSSYLGSVHKGAVFVIQQTTTRVSSRPLLILKLGLEKSCGFRAWVYP